MEDSECTHCFEKTKGEIDGWFKYLDCNNDKMISAENTYNGMKNMKDLMHAKTTTTMVNGFFVNAMEHHSAGLDIIDF